MSSTEARDEAAGAAATAPVSTNGQHRGPSDPGRGRRRGWLVVAAVLVVAAGAGGAAAAGVFSGSGGPGNGSSNSGYATSIATVTRQSLTSQTEVNATLGDAGTWTVSAPPSSSSAGASSGSSTSGTLTWLPQVGWTVRQGQAIYKVSGTPVVLLYGNVPAYRDLSEGLTGPDVTELNTGLVRLGYLKASSLGPRSGWDVYSAATVYGVEQFQLHYGMTETGTLSLGEAVFLPGQALVTGWSTGVSVGGPEMPGAAILTASSTTPVVSIALDPGLQGQVRVGDPVSITLPDGVITRGMVSQVQRVATSSSSSDNSGSQGSGGSQNGSSSSATITVLASLKHPKAAGDLNQAPVTVTITTGSVTNAIVVPVNALLAETGGKFCVEVVSGSQHHLVSVVPGLFDDAAGLVQVTGNLTPGEHVVVPGI